MIPVVLTLPFSVPTSSLGAIDPTKLIPLGPVGLRPESDSYEHWVLGGGPGSLIGIKSGGALTSLNGGLAWNSNYVDITPANSRGLVSDLSDSSVQTMCAVVRMPLITTTFLQVIFGSSGGTGSTAGSLGFFSGASGFTNRLLATLRSVASSVGTVDFSGTISPGDWIFVGMSENTEGSNRSLIMYVGGFGSVTLTPSGQKTVSSNKLALGPAYYTTSQAANHLEAAEFILYDSARTAQQMAFTHAMSKIRMSQRGITLK